MPPFPFPFAFSSDTTGLRLQLIMVLLTILLLLCQVDDEEPPQPPAPSYVSYPMPSSRHTFRVPEEGDADDLFQYFTEAWNAQQGNYYARS